MKIPREWVTDPVAPFFRWHVAKPEYARAIEAMAVVSGLVKSSYENERYYREPEPRIDKSMALYLVNVENNQMRVWYEVVE